MQKVICLRADILIAQTIFLWTLVARQVYGTLDTTASLEEQWLFPELKKKDSSEPVHGTPGFFHSSGQASLVRELFELFDTEGKGRLGEKELASAIYAMGFNTHHHHEIAKILLSQFSEDGHLLMKHFTELIHWKITGRNPEEQIIATFDSLCGDNPNFKTINFERLKSKVGKLKIRLSDSELRDMIRDVDRNDDGQLDLEEYMLILNQSTWI